MVASCASPSNIKLKKTVLDDFYSFAYGDESMGRNPPPSLRVVMTAERKVWRQVALMMSKDETVTISSTLKSIQDKSRFWAVEIDEFCVRRQVKGHKGEGKHQSKGKTKGKFEKPGKIKRGKGASLGGTGDGCLWRRFPFTGSFNFAS